MDAYRAGERAGFILELPYDGDEPGPDTIRSDDERIVDAFMFVGDLDDIPTDDDDRFIFTDGDADDVLLGLDYERSSTKNTARSLRRSLGRLGVGRARARVVAVSVEDRFPFVMRQLARDLEDDARRLLALRHMVSDVMDFAEWMDD